MIMGPFKPYVLEALGKIKDLEFDVICPGHGPVLRQNLDYYIELYRQWSTPVEVAEGEKTVHSLGLCYGLWLYGNDC